MSLLIRGTDLGYGANMLQTTGGSMRTQSVYGLSCSLMVATREGGYHSRPHRHRSEQVNYVTDGQIWVFVEHEAFLAETGDFYRIPGNAVHWGWNLSTAPVSTFQVFAPPVDPYTRKNSMPLLTEAEQAVVTVEHSLTEYLDDEEPYLEFERRWHEDLRAARTEGDR